ncbi:hypothetical protein ACFRAA_33210 [[Kitasatospora] papulosa]|uniref:hypothetical protein n=1 Tax=[Kitasatospora] papulosa TaxID=1464011 RepID=UPI0036344EDF
MSAASSWVSFSSAAGQADLQAFDLAESAFALSLDDPVEQVVADLEQTISLGWLRPEE